MSRFVQVGAGFLALYVFFALAAPWIGAHDPYAMDAAHVLSPPSAEHLFGTDSLGRDIASRILYGTRRALGASVPAVALALVSGSILGAIAASGGRFADSVISRSLDVAFALPDVLLALLVIAILGPGETSLIVAIAIVYTPIFARIARSTFLQVRKTDYVEAARSLGASTTAIVWRHVVPNALAPLLVQTTLSLAFAVLAEAALSYLGLGVEPDVPSWGMMLNQGRAWLEVAPWISVFPGLALAGLVMSLNAVGDGLRDALDPRLRVARAASDHDSLELK
jgi:peptide/nickel transport system permease protein